MQTRAVLFSLTRCRNINILSPNPPFSLPHHVSYGECEGDFAVVARRVLVLRTATKGGGWVDSELTDLHLFLESRPHLTHAKV